MESSALNLFCLIPLADKIVLPVYITLICLQYFVTLVYVSGRKKVQLSLYIM